MLERVPDALTEQFVGALQRYRQSITEGQYDSDAVELLQLVLLSSSNNAGYLALRDQAMERLYNGSYGTCMSCHEEISKKRLIALPFQAKLCLDCQEVREHNVSTTSSKSTMRRYQDPELNLPKRQPMHIIDPPRKLPKHLVI